MQTISRTVYGALLQTAQLLGTALPVMPHTTLNEKLSINQNVALASTDMPTMRYVCIGNGGHKMSLGTNGVYIPEPLAYEPTSSALYNQLPFVLRLPSNDLTALERANYRMRRIEQHGGVNYVAYYAKLIASGTSTPQIDLNTDVGGVITAAPYVPTVANLNPTPPLVSNTNVIVTTGNYVTASAKVPFVMNVNDVNEFINVSNIIYQNPNYAIVSEIALCSGVDKQVNGDFNGVTSVYTDVISMQVVSFLNAMYAMQFSNTGIDMLLEIGASEPMSILA